MIKKWGVQTALMIILAAASAWLLKGDVWVFWTWWLMAGVMGLGGMPLTGRLFGALRTKAGCFRK